MEFTMFRFSTRNRKNLLKARQGETRIIKKCAFTSNYFKPYGCIFRNTFLTNLLKKHCYISIPLHQNILAPYRISSCLFHSCFNLKRQEKLIEIIYFE